MDSHTRGKLIKAGYAIFRFRDEIGEMGKAVSYDIREFSSRGEWVLQGKYPTKAARERAWTELMKNPMNLAD